MMPDADERRKISLIVKKWSSETMLAAQEAVKNEQTSNKPL